MIRIWQTVIYSFIHAKNLYYLDKQTTGKLSAKEVVYRVHKFLFIPAIRRQNFKYIPSLCGNYPRKSFYQVMSFFFFITQDWNYYIKIVAPIIALPKLVQNLVVINAIQCAFNCLTKNITVQSCTGS